MIIDKFIVFYNVCNPAELPFENLPTMFATCSDAVSSPCHALECKK